ncbi:MAG: hypothetical protein U0359_23265 [Byssovorax sp.]
MRFVRLLLVTSWLGAALAAGACEHRSSGAAGATGGMGGAAGSPGTGGDDLTVGAGGVIAGSGGAPSCPEAGAPPDASDPSCASAEPGLTYQQDIRPIMTQQCTGELCHLPPSYDFLVGQPSPQCCNLRLRVAPFDPAHSYLMNKLTGEGLCAGAPMPLGKPPLDPSLVARVHDWICAGAPLQ